MIEYILLPLPFFFYYSFTFVVSHCHVCQIFWSPNSCGCMDVTLTFSDVSSFLKRWDHRRCTAAAHARVIEKRFRRRSPLWEDFFFFHLSGQRVPPLVDVSRPLFPSGAGLSAKGGWMNNCAWWCVSSRRWWTTLVSSKTHFGGLFFFPIPRVPGPVSKLQGCHSFLVSRESSVSWVLLARELGI